MLNILQPAYQRGTRVSRTTDDSRHESYGSFGVKSAPPRINGRIVFAIPRRKGSAQKYRVANNRNFAMGIDIHHPLLQRFGG